MKGLLKSCFFGIKGNLRVIGAAALLLGGICLIMGDPSVVSIFPFLPAPVLGAAAVACLRRESASRWSRYKITLPVRRKDIVKSQYISHGICALAGMACAGIFLCLALIIHGNIYFYYGFRDVLTLILGGGILAVFMGAIAYPPYYWWGEEKTEIIIALSILGAVAVILALSMLINFLTGEGGVTDTQYYISLAVILLIAGAAYAGSCFLSALIYEKAEL